VDPLVRDAVTAIGRRDWPAVKALLHPYLRWMCADGRTVRGRSKVLAYLAATPPHDPPGRYEIRDGQIYRWIE
jgi:SnoaL-like domain